MNDSKEKHFSLDIYRLDSETDKEYEMRVDSRRRLFKEKGIQIQDFKINDIIDLLKNCYDKIDDPIYIDCKGKRQILEDLWICLEYLREAYSKKNKIKKLLKFFEIPFTQKECANCGLELEEVLYDNQNSMSEKDECFCNEDCEMDFHRKHG